MATISFDFDETLWDEDEFGFGFTDTLQVMKDHIAQGDKVVVVTARNAKWAEEAKKLLQKVGIEVEVFSCPWDVLYGETWEEKRNKSEMLIKLGANKHFDDLFQDDEFDDAKEAGIEILPPPHWDM